jgi:hypothetical protein
MTVADEIARVAAMPLPALRDEWRRLFRSSPPDSSADLLARAISWEVQQRRHGGLSVMVQRELARLAQSADRKPKTSGSTAPALKAGTRLIRDWGGRRHVVVVDGDGFVYRDRRYRSLTQIARDITGAGWSGPRFFGLIKPRASDARNG